MHSSATTVSQKLPLEVGGHGLCFDPPPEADASASHPSSLSCTQQAAEWEHVLLDSWVTYSLRRGAMLWQECCCSFLCSLRAVFRPPLLCPPSCTSACRFPPARGVPSWAAQLAQQGQEARAAPVPAAPSHRKASKGCICICPRGDVSASLPFACGLLPLQLCESRETLPSPPPCLPRKVERV